MQFSLFSLGTEHESTVCYFRLHTEEKVVYSPFYPDRRSALVGMEQLVRRLRVTTKLSELDGQKKGADYEIDFFDDAPPAVGSGTIFNDKEAAEETLLSWRSDARAATFKLNFWELAEIPEDLASLENLDFSEGDDRYSWHPAGSSLLRVDDHAHFSFRPKVGVQANVSRGSCEPIFKALTPFVATDLPLFRGRKKETEEVYTLLRTRPLLLLYGAPRVGKTSLLQCGLANRLKEEEERMIVVKREDEDILDTFVEAVKDEMDLSDEEVAALPEDPRELALYFSNYFAEQRIILVFDQLEQFFITDVYDAERAIFFQFVRDLTKSEDSTLRIILSLQEDFLAPVAEYEPELPDLLHNRYRLLPFQQNSMFDTTINLLDVFTAQNKIAVDDKEGVAEKVVSQLTNEKGEVPVHCLQIYLHQLHQGSCKETEEGPVPLTTDLIDRMGSAEQLIDQFYTERLTSLRKAQPTGDGPLHPMVEHEIEELEQGRKNCGCDEKKDRVLAGGAVVPVPTPWLSTAALAAVPFGLFFLYWWFNPAAANAADACELARQEDSCQAYVNYLCTYGEDADCSAEFRNLLAEKQCDVWEDYQRLRRFNNCDVYQQFYEKYRDSSICMDLVQAQLLDWGCPVVRDTVELTMRDTIIQRVPGPTVYGPIPGGQPSLSLNQPCQEFGNTTFKRVGPLWIMTTGIEGGPYAWEDALDACRARGWRLPCIGEIDFLLERIYDESPSRAYQMLTGNDACVLVNPTDDPGARIAFWTATEADDNTAWTYYFDTSSKILGRESATPKAVQLPCLCVQRDPDQQSGIPPCYEKQVDRRIND